MKIFRSPWSQLKWRNWHHFTSCNAQLWTTYERYIGTKNMSAELSGHAAGLGINACTTTGQCMRWHPRASVINSPIRHASFFDSTRLVLHSAALLDCQHNYAVAACASALIEIIIMQKTNSVASRYIVWKYGIIFTGCSHSKLNYKTSITLPSFTKALKRLHQCHKKCDMSFCRWNNDGIRRRLAQAGSSNNETSLASWRDVMQQLPNNEPGYNDWHSLKYAIFTKCHALIVHKSDFITLCHGCLACKPYTVTVQNIMTT